MKHRSLWKKARELVDGFVHARSGNVAVIFTVAIIPILGLAGAAIDFTRANSARTALQAALDTTALMISKDVTNLPEADIPARAQQYFNALYHRSDTAPVNLVVNYTTGATTIQLKGSTTMQTLLLKVVGPQTLAVGAASTAKWGDKRLRVSLVLDNSGSMNESDTQGNTKIQALLDASQALITQLQTASHVAGDVYVSIIPYDSRVNIGTNNVNLPWISWHEWDADWNNDWRDHHGTCSNSSDIHNRLTCTNSAAHCSDPQWPNKTKCQNHSKVWLTSAGTWTPSTTPPPPPDHSQWSGCIYDRGPNLEDSNLLTTTGQDYDQIISPATSDPKTWVHADPINGIIHPPPNGTNTVINRACLVPMMGLTDNWTALKSKANSMVAVGFTNNPIGLVWGWQSLRGGNTLTAPSLDSNFQYEHAIILLTDGRNSANLWFDDGDYKPEVDLRMYDSQGKGVCQNIKNDGIKIYSIMVNTNNLQTSQVLKNCASDGNFYEIKLASELGPLFKQIGDSLLSLRVAK